MQHSFDVKIAEAYGIEEAIILNHFYFWVEKNRANNQHFYDGNYWTYNSMKALKELFPYMTERQIDYTIKHLIEAGLVEKGNYNKVGFDRTLWYSITKKGYAILQNCEMDFTKLSNGTDKIVEPIPDIKPDIKPYIRVGKKFIPPTLEEVEEYAKSKGRGDLGRRFYEYYTADKEHAWIDSKGQPVRSWKQKFLTWCGQDNMGLKLEKSFGGNDESVLHDRKYTKEDMESLITNIEEIEI